VGFGFIFNRGGHSVTLVGTKSVVELAGKRELVQVFMAVEVLEVFTENVGPCGHKRVPVYKINIWEDRRVTELE
jgi:hypothetical protein